MAYGFSDPQYGVTLNLAKQGTGKATKTLSSINSTMVESLQSSQANLLETFGAKLAACTTNTLAGIDRSIKQGVNLIE